jgi:acyl dehydratase
MENGGMTKSYMFTITQKMHDDFVELSQSNNPLHTDEQYAKSRGFDGIIGYGFLTSSLLSRMVGEEIPGYYGRCNSMNIEFHNPVYIGDTLKYSGMLAKVQKSIKQVYIDVEITRALPHPIFGNRIAECLIAKGQLRAGVYE